MSTKEQDFFACSTWYHGTTLSGWESICKLGVRADYNIGISLDFGNGFYLSNNIENTERYVKNQVKFGTGINEKDKTPVVIEFDFVPGYWIKAGAKYRYFPQYNKEFAEFVFKNRMNYQHEKIHKYDITAGVTTDTKPTYLMQQYFLGKLQKDDVLHEFCKGSSVRQICIHNQRYCDAEEKHCFMYL